MNSILRSNSTINIIRLMIAIACIAIIAACGGGGGSPGVTSGTSGTPSISLIFTDSNGVSKNTITGSTPIVAKATIKDAAGAGVVGILVTFKSSSAIATIAPATGTAITDSNGLAQVTVQAGVGSGAASVTATATVGTTALTKTANFSVGASEPAAINFKNVVPADKSIVLKGAGGNGRTEVALLTFTVVDSTNAGVFNKKVTFKTTSSEAVTLVNDSGITAGDGTVTVALNSGAKPTTVRVIATVDGTTISTISDTVTVTTGQPAQAAFSMSLQTYAIEGLNWDNIQQNVLVLLADNFGAVVADGTQVVFTTDGGAIVGTGGAACLTVQGACSVQWRSQNPRPANGIVTLIATATNGTTNLSTTLQFYMSGSYGVIYEVGSNPVEGDTVRISTDGFIALRDFTGSCATQVMNIEVVDVNGNPMPIGTTLAIVNAGNASASIFPPSVAHTPPFFTSATRGTVHRLLVTPGACAVPGANITSGSFDISVTTPKGNVTYTHVNLKISST